MKMERVQRFRCVGCSLIWNSGCGREGDEPEYIREGRPATVRDHQPTCRLPELTGGYADWDEIGEPEWRVDGQLFTMTEVLAVTEPRT